VGHDVFISYATRDRPLADAALEHLEAAGTSCWIASRDISAGSDYSASIIDAISESRLLLLLLSRASNDSPQVKREVERAASKGLPIVPFRVEEFVLSKHMEYFISTAQWLDAFPPPLEPRLARLTEQVARLLALPARVASRGTAAMGTPGGSAPNPEASRTSPGPGSVAARPAPAQAPPAEWSGALPDGWGKAEKRFLGWMTPVLRTASRAGAEQMGGPAGETRGHGAAGPVPWGAVLSAGLVGGLGLFMSLRGILGSVVPSILGPEAMGMLVFPVLRLTGLLVGLATAVGNLALLVGARRAYVGAPDGLPLLWGAIRFVAVAMGIWLVASCLLVLVTGPAMARGPVVGALIGTGFLAAVQIAIVMFFVHRALQTASAGSRPTGGVA